MSIPQVKTPTIPINGTDVKQESNVEQEKILHYLPPINIVHTWNTKRIIPQILLDQYVPFLTIFLIDDYGVTNFSLRDTDSNNAILLGSPTDTVSKITSDYYRDSSKFSAFNENHLTYYYKDEIFTNQIDSSYRVNHISGIRASIKGYNNGKPVSLIPLTIKFSQLVTPEAKGVFEAQGFSCDVGNLYGYVNAEVTLICNDILQMFSTKSVASKFFQSFNKYLVCFGWHGPSIDEIKLEGEDRVIRAGDGSLKVKLLDGSEYILTVPSPL